MGIKVKVKVKKVKVKKDPELKNRERQLRQEVSRKASLANKRLKRLEKNDLTNLPAYRNWLDYRGGVKFSVKGKTHNELVAEMARLDKFINNKTSTVRGANSLLKDIAKNAGVTWKKIGELNSKLSKFFGLYSKVEQYLQSSLQLANAVGSDTIMKTVTNYVKDNEDDIASGMKSYKDMVESISHLVTVQYFEEAEDEFGDFLDML